MRILGGAASDAPVTPVGTSYWAVDSAGGAGGSLVVAGTNFMTVIPSGIAAGTYVIRVIGLGAGGQFTGTFSDAVSVVVQ